MTDDPYRVEMSVTVKLSGDDPKAGAVKEAMFNFGRTIGEQLGVRYEVILAYPDLVRGTDEELDRDIADWEKGRS